MASQSCDKPEGCDFSYAAVLEGLQGLCSNRLMEQSLQVVNPYQVPQMMPVVPTNAAAASQEQEAAPKKEEEEEEVDGDKDGYKSPNNTPVESNAEGAAAEQEDSPQGHDSKNSDRIDSLAN